MQTTSPQIYLPKNAILTLATLISVVMLLFAYMLTQGKFFLFVLLAVPYVVLLFSSPSFSLIGGIILMETGLYLPFLPQNLDISRLMLMVFACLAFASYIIRKETRQDKTYIRPFVILFALVFMITSTIRGIGFRVFGAESWGASYIVSVIICVFVFLFRNQIQLSPKQCKLCFFGMIAGSSLPVIADLLYYLSNNQLHQQYMFIKINSSSILSLAQSDTQSHGVWRLQRTIIFAPYLLLLLYYLRINRRINLPLFIVSLGAVIFLLGLSGHRAGIILSGLVAIVLFFLHVKASVLQKTCLILAAAVIMYIMALAAAPYLPRSFQRMIAFLPGVSVSTDVKLSAQGTARWRLILWREVAKDWKKYFWVGKGTASHSQELIDFYSRYSYALTTGNMSGFMGNIELAILTHDYHNGPLSLFIDNGIFGTIAFIPIMLGIAREGINSIRRRKWNDIQLLTIYKIMLAALLAEMIHFFIIYGFAIFMFNRMLLIGSMLYLIKKADEKTDIRMEKKPEPAKTGFIRF